MICFVFEQIFTQAIHFKITVKSEGFVYLFIWIISLTWCPVQLYELLYQGDEEDAELQGNTLSASLAAREEMIEQKRGLN